MANINTDRIVIGDDTLVLQDADLRSKKVNAFQNSPDHSHYPSEKLVKDSLDAKLNKSQKGANDGLAELDGTGKVPLSQLPNMPDVSTKYDTDDTASTEIADADYVPFYDTSASGRRKTLWSNIKARLKSYFDTLYLTAHQDISGKADKVSNPINGNLAKIDANGNMADSGVATSGVSDAVSKKHSHTNKSILDLIPTTLGTSGQVLSIGNNSNMEWRTPTSGGQGSSTLSGLTDTDIQSPSHGQFLRYDADESKWVNDTFGGIFIATITTTEESGVTTYSCDKTFDEIAAAIESGLRVRMFDVASGAICENVCLITIGVFGFQGVGINTSDITNDVNVFIFCMQNNGVDVFAVSYVSNLLPPMSGKSGKVLTNNGTKASWTDFPEELPSLRNNANKILKVNSDATGVEWVDNIGGLTNYDFAHRQSQSVNRSVTVTYNANTRGSRMVFTSDDLSVAFVVNNDSDNYLWIKNAGSADIDILISSVTHNDLPVNNVYIPDNGITVPAGKVCEIGIVVNSDGAFITSRSDLSL